ncbi:FAD-binding oxidoreductase [Desulfogranum mediterraneum]|uniref:FAD-binding oxidoreductase n=1 Tax=Desulfogranum mediterraneum TaxID=160661 RepID=UPI0004294A8D|nr:FAD-binding oxidoreductase [Desulfogranum mediterraneum]
MSRPLASRRQRRLTLLSAGSILLGLLAAGATVPFLFESTTMLYKFGWDRGLLRLGKVVALWATLLLPAQLMMVARWQWLDRLLGGRFLRQGHRLGAGLILLLVLAHPLLILLPEGLDNLPLGWKFWPELVGAALLALLILQSLAALLPHSGPHAVTIPYHIRQRTHRLVGLFLPLLLLIHIRFVSDTFRQPLPATLLLIVGLAFLLLTALSLARPLRASRGWQVSAVQRLNPTIHSLLLEPVGATAFDYLPGQYAFLRVRAPGISREPHPFSLSSTPTRTEALRFTIRSCGDWTDAIQRLPAGARVEISGPYGEFSHLQAPGAAALFLIAGGIGITPMISMLTFMADQGEQRPVQLLWSCRSREELVFAAELAQLAGQLKELRLHYHLSGGPGARGRLGRAELAPMVSSLPCPGAAFLCGPGAMVRELRGILLELGYARRDIHDELFSL